jgi:hypothetical protein
MTLITMPHPQSSSARQDRFERFMPGPQHDLPHAILPEAPPKRPTLECTVCGPGAAGPWRVSVYDDLSFSL